MNKKRSTGHPKKLFVVITALVSLILLAGVLETAVRIRQWVIYGAPATLQSFSVDPKTGLRVPESGSTVGRIRVNSVGFRSPELESPKPRNTIRLAFLGGSTTWCAEVSGNEMTWPHLVWSQLQQTFPGVTFDYLNAAVPGYTVDSSLKTLENRVKQFSPDVIIIYHATNDLIYITRKLAIQQGIFSGKAENPSWLGEWSLAWFLIEKNLQLRTRQKAALEEQARLTFNPKEISNEFRETLTTLVDASKTVAKIVAVATFSQKLRREQNRDEQIQAANTSIFYMPYMTIEGLLTAFEEYNKVIREVVESKKILLIGDENLIPGDERHFNDSVHFKDAGSQAMAGRVIESLANAPSFQQLVKELTNIHE